MRSRPRPVHGGRRRTMVALALALSVVVPGCSGRSKNESASTGASADAAEAPRPPARSNGLVFGAILSTNSPAWAPVLDRDDVRGALVVAVVPSSPAAAAHIDVGSVIVAVDGQEIDGADQAGLLLRTTKEANHAVSLALPDGESRTVSVQLLASAPVSIAQYLQQTLARDGSPLSRYLYAQVTQDPDTARRLAGLVTHTAPLFAAGHLLEAQLALNASRRAAGKADLPAQDVAVIKDGVARATSLGGTSAEVLSASASILVALGEPVAALAYATRAAELDPGSAKASLAVGTAQLALGNGVSAVHSLRRAVELDPYNPALYAPLARAYQATGQLDAAKATEATFAVLRSQSRPPSPASQTLKVAVALAVDMAIVVVLLSVLGGWRGSPRARGRRRERPAAKPVGSLVEAMAALGAWSIVIPWVGPAFGYAPESVLRLEIADHVVPGIVLLVLAARCLPLLVDGRLDGWAQMPITAALFLVTGLWMTAAHLPLLVQAAHHVRSWNLAFFHSSAGLATLGVGGVLCRRAWTGDHADVGAVRATASVA